MARMSQYTHCPDCRHTLKLLVYSRIFVELTENPEVMQALDDLVVGSVVMLDAFLVSLSRNELLLGSDYSTLFIIVGLYFTTYADARAAGSTMEECHNRAMQYIANHPIGQTLATQATQAAVDRVAEVKE